jgi:DNA-binding transcriptional ArsR family regulator
MTADRLSTTFSALADPTRRAILARLISGEISVTELAEPFRMSLPAVSKHLKVLERAGLIARSREAQWRPCQLNARPLKEVADWAEHYRKFYEQSFDRLDIYLRGLKEKQGKAKDLTQRKQRTKQRNAEESKHGRAKGKK